MIHTPSRERWRLLLAALITLSLRGPEAARPEVEALFADFWSAATSQAADAAAAAIVASGITFEDAFGRLRIGRRYSRDVPTGVVLLSRRADGEEFPYSLDVPADYDPSRRNRVRVQLHGGIGAGEDNRRRGSGGIEALAGDEQLYVLPTSWLDAPWWSDAQLRNLRAILDSVKRTYNIDENRVVLSGVSDGGTGSFYVAMRDPTPFASFLPLIGSLMALAGRNLGLGDLFPNNLLNKPFFVVNGERDLLYPTAAIDPIVRDLRRAGVDITYRPQRGGGHDVAWWPAVRSEFEAFAREHSRNPLPNVLTWQSGEGDSFNRIAWLIIDRIGSQPALSTPPDVNLIPTPATLRFGVQAVGARILRLLPGSNAAALGLKPQDIIIAVNSEALSTGRDLAEVLDRCCRPGAAVVVQVTRGGETVLLRGTYEPQSTYGSRVPLFAHRRPSGRVDLVRTGNTVRATTTGVSAYTLLLSPSAFDFRRPVTIVTNGRVSFEGTIPVSVATLFKWASIDNDRTMLFGSELHVRVE